MASDRTPPPRLLVVVAHPDDETFGCGSLLLHAAALGAWTTVVCVTRGELGEVVAGVEAPQGLGALREHELRAAARRLRVGAVEVLGFTDSGMDGACSAGAVCADPPERLDDAIRTAMNRHRPDVVVTLDGADGHRDHLRVRRAVEEALRGSDVALYLQALPRSLMHAWVRERAGDVDSAGYTALPDIGTPDEEITTVVDTSGLLDQRLEAIAEHRSQRSPFEGLSDGLRDAFLGREHLVRVNPPWAGGPCETDLLGLAGDTSGGQR